MEVLLDDSKSVGLDFRAIYRILKFNSISTSVKSNSGGPTLGSPLLNLSDGGSAALDFSGIQVGASVRFYLGKGDN